MNLMDNKILLKLELVLQFHLKLKKRFYRKRNLKERKANPQKKLVGLELIGKEHAGHGDCVHVGRSQVGIVTSGCLSTTLNKNIALCRIDTQYSEPGTEVEVGKIDGHQKRISAKVVVFHILILKRLELDLNDKNN